jgi:SMI1 / KNR4 family (SUKH-1)
VTAFEDEKPPVSAAELQAAEQALATYRQRIPPSYRAFLAERDGGRPVPDCFVYEKDNEEQMGIVHGFLGVGEVPAPQVNLLFSADVLQGRILPGVLPVADTPTGNVVCIDTRDGRDGPVLLWDHEYEGDPPDEANLYFIAPDFQTFLDELHEDPDPLPPARKPKGLKRLFGRN